MHILLEMGYRYHGAEAGVKKVRASSTSDQRNNSKGSVFLLQRGIWGKFSMTYKPLNIDYSSSQIECIE